jgi:hypothetical protein
MCTFIFPCAFSYHISVSNCACEYAWVCCSIFSLFHSETRVGNDKLSQVRRHFCHSLRPHSRPPVINRHLLIDIWKNCVYFIIWNAFVRSVIKLHRDCTRWRLAIMVGRSCTSLIFDPGSSRTLSFIQCNATHCAALSLRGEMSGRRTWSYGTVFMVHCKLHRSHF